MIIIIYLILILYLIFIAHENSHLITLQINGPDSPGVFLAITRYLSEQSINIEDVSQNVIQGYLGITFILDIEKSLLNLDRLELGIKALARKLNVNVAVYDHPHKLDFSEKDLYVLVMMGPDTIGILTQIAAILTFADVNIENVKIKSREGWLFNQFILDLKNVADVEALKELLRYKCEELNLSMVLQTETNYRRNKRLIAFDMDSTMVVGETIVDIAELMGIEDEMQEATEYAMHNDVNFEDSLRYRVGLIKGVSEEMLIDLAEASQIMPGAQELVRHLKSIGYKIALVSSGFSIFTEIIKERLDLDYAFGNTLEIKDGKVTGKVIGDIIDGQGKWDIIASLCDSLGIDYEETVTVGDGSNDKIMLSMSGLGIGLNSKEIASKAADGKVLLNDVSKILFMLGLSDTKIDQLINSHTSDKYY